MNQPVPKKDIPEYANGEYELAVRDEAANLVANHPGPEFGHDAVLAYLEHHYNPPSDPLDEEAFVSDIINCIKDSYPDCPIGDFPNSESERDQLAEHVVADFLTQNPSFNSNPSVNPRFNGEEDVERFLQRAYVQRRLEWQIAGKTFFPTCEDVRSFVRAVCEKIIERLPETEKPKPPEKHFSLTYGRAMIIVGWRPLLRDQSGKWRGQLSISLLPNEGPTWYVTWYGYAYFFVHRPKFVEFIKRYYPGDPAQLYRALKKLNIGF
jgi:hypothetical protein